jgi:WD40 repeat protein
MAMADEIIDFELERGRHGALLEREDVMAEVEAFLAGASRGWVLVKGGPGLGKSALLATWLKRREQAGQRVSHHFLRRGVEDWDKPEVVKRNLAAQVEALFPELKNPEPRPDSRLRELLQRVSKQVLEPRKQRLVLLVDGLDEVEGEADGSNPLKRFLPPALPPGVWMLCASRPTYPYLSWLEGLGEVRTIDLDSERWAGSNTRLVREYWAQARSSPRFQPPLTPAFTEEIVQRAQGNILYSVKLAEWLEGQPVEKRRAELLPEGLEKLLDESWEHLQALPAELRTVAEEGLGVVAVAREALPRSILAEVAGWKELGAPERFLKVARAFLLEEKERERGEKAWRPFHESFRSFILSKLGERRERELHLRLAQRLGEWPVSGAEKGFRTSYALRHGVTHWLKAEQWEQARRLYTDLGYLENRCRVAGVVSVEEALNVAATEGPERERKTARALARAIQAGSHVLRTDPEPLTTYVYNWLRCAGWTAERLLAELSFPQGLPELRLRFPVSVGGNVRTLEGHGAWVTSCAVTPDGRRVLSASWDHTLKVWELGTGRELASLQGHGDKVMGCAVTPDGRRVVSASADKTLKVWELETGRELATLQGHGDAVTGCAVTPDGRRVVSASWDKTLKVWELETGRELATLKGHGAWVTGCAVTPDGQRAVSASYDDTLKVWELETGRELATLQGHGARVTRCAVTPDGRRVVSASADTTLKVWELETGRELATLQGHQASVTGCAVMPDGRRVVSASADTTLKVWELETGRELATLKGHGAWVTSCAVTPDGRRVVSASWDKTLKAWELETGREPAALQGHGSWVMGCAVTPDGRRVVSASDDTTLKAWELETGRELATLQGHQAPVMGCVVTPDGRRVVSASWDKTLKVWELETGRELATLKGHGARVTSCVVTPDGRRVVSASADTTLKVWELETGRELATLQGHGARVTSCAVTPDGQRMVSASVDRTLKMWELEMGRELATLKGHGDIVTGCAVTLDGRRMVSASADKTLKVWELETGRELASLQGHREIVTGCAVTPDGRRVVSASWDKTLKVWDLDSGQCLSTLHGFNAFNTVASEAGIICAGDVTGNVWILEAGSAALKASVGSSREPEPATPMDFSFPPPLLEAWRSRKLALCIGSGLSLSEGVQGNFPTWKDLSQRFIEACARYGVADDRFIQSQRSLFESSLSLEDMLAALGVLRSKLGKDFYQRALNDIFRPRDARPGPVHRAIAQLGVRAVLTTNYDPLIEEVSETPRRSVFSWKESAQALHDLKEERPVLLKIHGSAERSDTVVMTELEYHHARADRSYQAVLSHLFQGYTFLFLGYGMNDPLDIDRVLKWNADCFGPASTRHYALMKQPSDKEPQAPEWDRCLREYNVQVLGYRQYGDVTPILEQLARLAAP